MKRKNLNKVSLILLLFSFLLTGVMFAYWANSVSGDQTELANTITIGAGEELTTTINAQEVFKTTGKLVPVGYESEGSVSEIQIKYNILLSPNEAGASGVVANLQVTYESLDSPLLIVNITTTSEEIVADGEAVIVTVKITLQEPQNVEEYNSVANLNFNISLTFKAVI